MRHENLDYFETGTARAPRTASWGTNPVRMVLDLVERRPLVSIFLLALLARLAAALMVGGGFRFFDETEYVDAARRLLAGHGFDPRYPREPAYPIVLAALMSPLPSSLLFLRAGQATAAAFGCLLIYTAGRRLFGHAPALGAAFWYAVDPLAVITAVLFYPEALAALGLLAAIVSLLNAVRRDRLLWSVATGALLGLVIQMRAVALVLPPVLMAWSVLAPRGAPRRRRLLHALAISAATVVVLLPWTYRNYAVHGRLVPVSMSGSANAPMRWRSEAKAQGLAASMVHRIFDDPAAFAQRTLQQLGYFWELSPSRLVTDDPQLVAEMHEADERLPTEPVFTPSLRDAVSAVSFGGELLFALIGACVAWRRGVRRETILLLAIMMAYALGFALFFAKLRYRMTVLPEMFLFAGLGLAAAWNAAASVRIGVTSITAVGKEPQS